MRFAVPALFLAAVFACPAGAAAQTAAPDPAQPAPAAQPNPDRRIDPLEPDFALAALPTTARLAEDRWAFRVTHRFTRAIGDGSIGDLIGDAFGLDGSAQIGLEVRRGILPGVQAGIHRTSDRSIQIFGQQNVFSERYGDAFSLDGLATLEGSDNLTEDYRVALGVLLSKVAGGRAVVYAEPMAVLNSNPLDDDADASHTLMVGLGARLHVRPSLYAVAEFTPRLAGYDPGDDQASVALEHRAGGHVFQLNLSNGFGTTLGQLARGTHGASDWYLGFNISRRF